MHALSGLSTYCLVAVVFDFRPYVIEYNTALMLYICTSAVQMKFHYLHYRGGMNFVLSNHPLHGVR